MNRTKLLENKIKMKDEIIREQALALRILSSAYGPDFPKLNVAEHGFTVIVCERAKRMGE